MINLTIGSNVSGRTTKIIPETTTLREALESSNIEYDRFSITLNGDVINHNQLDETFESFGVSERASLLVTTKLDFASSVKIAGNSAIITLAYSYKELESVQKHRPECLTIVENGEPKFSVCAGSSGKINRYGAEFENSRGDAIIAIPVPADSDPAEFVYENFGYAITCLNRVENMMADAIGMIAAEKEAIMRGITVA